MKKILLLLFLCIVCLEGFSKDDGNWRGSWQKEDYSRDAVQELPFHSECFNDVLVITNETPDRDIRCEIMDEKGQVLTSCEVNKENSSRIVLSISELPEHNSYTIVLTSSNPMDRVYSTFEK